MGYYAGDIPAHPLVIEPALDELEDFDTATATLTSPDGETVTTLDAEIEGTDVVVTWPPAPSILPVRGAYPLRVTLENTDGAAQRLPVVMVIVQDDSDGWHSLDSVREVWEDAPENDRWLYELLEVAKSNVVAFGTNLPAAEQPAALRRAQQMQARNLWNVAAVNTQGEFGDGSFAITPHPLDWMIMQVLRPKRAVGGMA